MKPVSLQTARAPATLQASFAQSLSDRPNYAKLLMKIAQGSPEVEEFTDRLFSKDLSDGHLYCVSYNASLYSYKNRLYLVLRGIGPEGKITKSFAVDYDRSGNYKLGSNVPEGIERIGTPLKSTIMAATMMPEPKKISALP